MRVDLLEWQDIAELPEFKDNPFLPVKRIPPHLMPFLQVMDTSESGLRIKAKNYVGIFPLDEDIVLTINPKAPVEDFLHLLYKASGKDVSISELGEILRVSKGSPREYPNIFSFLLNVLLLELEKIRVLGFYKKSESVTHHRVVKGKLLIKETVNRWLKGDITNTVCQVFELSKDNPQNRAIKFTLWLLLSVYSGELSIELTEGLFEKYRWFEDIALPRSMDFLKEVQESVDFRALPSSRSYYYDILNLCLLFIENSALDFTATKDLKVRAFVVDMNRVFENYVFRVLRESLGPGYEVKRYEEMPLFDNAIKFRIKPDFLIVKDGRVELVADAKYERQPVVDNFYQVLIYAERIGVPNCLLVYPSWEGRTFRELFTFKDKRVNVFYLSLQNLAQKEVEFKLLLDDVLGMNR